jgi:hypothetical protein
MTLEERDAYDEIALQETGKQSLTGNATLGSGAGSLLAQGAAKLEGNEFKFYAAKQAHDRQVAEYNDASAGDLWGGLTGSMEAINSLEKQAAAAEALIGPEQAEKARLEGGAASMITDPSTILTMGVGGFVGKGGVALSMTAKAEKAALARLAALEATSARAAAETVAKRSAELSRQAAARADNLQALGKDATMARGYSERMATRSAEAWDDVTRLDGVIAVRAGDVAKLTKDARVAEALLGIGERARAMRAVPFKAFGELAERMGAGIIKLDDGLREAATKYGFESVGKVLSNPLTPVAIGAVTAGPLGAVVAGAGRALASGPVLKSIGNFSRVVGAETLQRRGMIPFWQRVANNSTLTPVARATAHLLDTATLGGKAGIPLRMAGQAAKGTAAAAPIDMAFEWVEAGGDLGPAEMKQALAESIIFGGGAGVVAGSRNALQQQQLGDEINFRNGLVDREVLAFGRMNPGARRVLSSYAAANPALRFNLTTEGNSYMDRTSNTMTLNTRQSNWMAPIIGHEVSHFIQIKGQMEAGITAMLVGDGATGGILRAPDGALNPDFKRFADAYNGRLVAQGINPLPIGDIAIEYFTESTVDDITTMVESGELARMAGRSNAERMVREMSRNLIGRVPFIRDLSMKFGTGMDRGGRMVMGTGILADGVRTIPGARAMLRGLMREQAGRRGDGVISEESATIPVQIMRDDPAMRSAMFSTLETDAAGNPIVDANGNVSITSRETELRRMAAGLIITELEAERIQNGRQLPEGELAPQTDGSWQGTHLSPESLQRLADSGVFNAKQLAMLGMLNRSAKGLTGETFLMIYQAATIPRKGKRKGYGTLPATFREVVPVGVKITKDGNIIVETMSVTQLVENVRERAASKRGKRLYNGSQVEILRDAQAVLDLHRKGERTDAYFADKYGSINGPEYKNFVNTAFGLMTRSQQDVNPIFAADSIRAGGVFKSRRLDRINQTTRMQGKPLFRFGYEQVKANMAPNGIPDPNVRMLPQEVPGAEESTENQQEETAEEGDLVVGTQADIPTTVDAVASVESALELSNSKKWGRARSFKQAIQDRVRAAAGAAGVDVSMISPQGNEYLVRLGLSDAIFALRQNPNAVGWYDEKTRQALGVMALMHPEIATDENARFAFVWALAVTSNGLKVGKNFELAERAYSSFKRTGQMPTDIKAGQAQAAINDSLKLFNDLRDNWGIDNLRMFMQTHFTVGEIGSISKELSPGGEHVATQVRGSAILGPKIGNGFFSNLYGYFDSLTMDRWLIRTWGRWTGTLITETPTHTQEGRDRLDRAVAALGKEGMSSLGADVGTNFEGLSTDELALALQKASTKPALREKMQTSPARDEIRKAGNSLAKYLDGQKEAPAGPTERNYIRSIFSQILSEVQTIEGFEDLTMADLQAVLWYAEKRLYEATKEDSIDGEETEGYEDSEAPDYANAAADVARAKGISERKIQNAFKKYGRAATARRSNGSPEAGPSVAGQQADAGGFTAKKRREFLQSLAVGRARSHRASDGGKSWSFTRDGGANGGRLRLLKSLGIRYSALWKSGAGLKRVYKAAGLAAPDFVEIAANDPQGAAKFADSIQASKDATRFGASVYVYPAADYQNMRLFITKDGASGFALKPDGDIVSVFSSGGAGHSVIDLAVQAGGRKLDAFETILPRFYGPHGFRAASRLAWDDSQAPEGWSKQVFREFNGGEPDVVFMVYDPKYSGWYSGKDGKKARDYGNALNIQKRAMPPSPPREGKRKAKANVDPSTARAIGEAMR